MSKSVNIYNYKKRKIFTLTYQRAADGDVLSCRLNGKKCQYVVTHSRIVFKCGKYVIKAERYGGQNYAEWKGFKRIKGRDRKYFAEVIGHSKDDLFLVQKFVNGKTRAHNINHYDVLHRLRIRYRIDDLNTTYNVLYKRHGPVIYDLGYMGQ